MRCETLRTRLNNQEPQAARMRIRGRLDSARIDKVPLRSATKPPADTRTIKANEEKTDVSELVKVTYAATAAESLYASYRSRRGNRGGRRGRGRGRGGRNVYSAGRSARGLQVHAPPKTTPPPSAASPIARYGAVTPLRSTTPNHCGLSSHFRAYCIHRKRAQEQRNKIRNQDRQLRAIANGDRDMPRLADHTNAVAFTAAAVTAVRVADSHHMCNGRSSFTTQSTSSLAMVRRQPPNIVA